ncbi:MAG: hypothetical protein UGF89_07715 [Acutalibacteraceae bacterium]|nr:hypothetical protein [Acutalibacteraceae bacterium]
MNADKNKKLLVGLLTEANQDGKVIGIEDTADYLIKRNVVVSPVNKGDVKDFLMMLLDTDMSGSEGGYAFEMADFILNMGFVLPPCKIGDTVYKVTETGTKKEVVYDFVYDGKVFRVRFNPGSPLTYEFGRDVFFEKKDAEAEWERRFG